VIFEQFAAKKELLLFKPGERKKNGAVRAEKKYFVM